MSRDSRLTGVPASPVPSARMRELDFFLGCWQAVGIVHPMTPDAPGKPIEMRIEGSAEASGFWITRRARELPTAQNPVPLTGFAVWGYDAGTDEFVGYWYDSAGCRAKQRSRGGTATASSWPARSSASWATPTT